ncbi:MAG: YbjN domain-containing protein [Actinomycetota bacterium]
MTSPADPDQLQMVEALLDDWLAREIVENPTVADVARDVDGPRSWFVRLTGEQREVFTVRFHLGQRTLHYETYFLPAPEENQALVYEHLLRRNAKLYGASFQIGDEDALYLAGQIDNATITEPELDRILGSMYAWTEQYFMPALKLAFASKFATE